MSKYRYNVSLSIGTADVIEDIIDLVDDLGESETYLEKLDLDRLGSLVGDYVVEWALNYINVDFSLVES